MRSTTDRCTLDVALRGILLGIFLTRFTCPMSGQLEKNVFRTSLIPVRLIRRKCMSFIRRRLESTSWRLRCGWAMRACKPRTVELDVGLFFKTQARQKYLQKTMATIDPATLPAWPHNDVETEETTILACLLVFNCKI